MMAGKKKSKAEKPETVTAENQGGAVDKPEINIELEPKKLAVNDEQLAGLSGLAPEGEDFVPSVGSDVAPEAETEADKSVERKQALNALIATVSGLADSFLPGYGLVEAEVGMLIDPLDAVLDKYCDGVEVGPEVGLAIVVLAITAPRVIKYRSEVLEVPAGKKEPADGS
jgi:hypothetical protein